MSTDGAWANYLPWLAGRNSRRLQFYVSKTGRRAIYSVWQLSIFRGKVLLRSFRDQHLPMGAKWKSLRKRWWIDKSVTYKPFGTEKEKGRRMKITTLQANQHIPKLVKKWQKYKNHVHKWPGNPGKATSSQRGFGNLQRVFPTMTTWGNRMKPYPKWPRFNDSNDESIRL